LVTLLHGTPAAAVSQALRHGTMNGITELSQRAPPIGRWVAITFGIGPHSSFLFGLGIHWLNFVQLFLQRDAMLPAVLILS